MLLFLYPLETLGKKEFPDVLGGWKEKIDLKRLTVILIKWILQKTRSVCRPQIFDIRFISIKVWITVCLTSLTLFLYCNCWATFSLREQVNFIWGWLLLFWILGIFKYSQFVLDNLSQRTVKYLNLNHKKPSEQQAFSNFFWGHTKIPATWHRLN